DRLLDLESVQKVLEIDGERRRLAVSDRRIRKKPRRAVAAQVRDDYAITGLCEHGRDIDKAVNVIGPTVQQNHNGSTRWTALRVTYIQDAGIDLLQRSERRICSWLDC